MPVKHRSSYSGPKVEGQPPSEEGLPVAAGDELGDQPALPAVLAHDKLHLAADLGQQLQGLQGMQCHWLRLEGKGDTQRLQGVPDTGSMIDVLAVQSPLGPAGGQKAASWAAGRQGTPSVLQGTAVPAGQRSMHILFFTVTLQRASEQVHQLRAGSDTG